jgi:hypothetical protein
MTRAADLKAAIAQARIEIGRQPIYLEGSTSQD